jgi:hypothetical protein
VNITDMNGAPIGYGNGGVAWGAALSIRSKLADTTNVTPQTGVSNKLMKRISPFPRTEKDNLGHHFWKKLAPPSHPRPLYEKGTIDFAVGVESWNTTSSACSDGGWDNGQANDFFGTLIFGNSFLPVSPPFAIISFSSSTLTTYIL